VQMIRRSHNARLGAVQRGHKKLLHLAETNQKHSPLDMVILQGHARGLLEHDPALLFPRVVLADICSEITKDHPLGLALGFESEVQALAEAEDHLSAVIRYLDLKLGPWLTVDGDNSSSSSEHLKCNIPAPWVNEVAIRVYRLANARLVLSKLDDARWSAQVLVHLALVCVERLKVLWQPDMSSDSAINKG
jgi:hypothetical protein